jgi:anti-sigma B factor antagonist
MSAISVFFPTRILSSANTADLLYWVRDQLARNSFNNKRCYLLVNLKNVLFMDSTGLTALVTAHKMVLEANGRLALCGLQGQAQMLFEMASMEKVFEIYQDAGDFERSLTQHDLLT